MSELELINKDFGRLKINGVIYYDVPKDIYNVIEELQQENKELKEKNRVKDKTIVEAINWLKDDNKVIDIRRKKYTSIYEHFVNERELFEILERGKDE